MSDARGPVAALIPAAGSGRRMGRDKRLLELEGETLLRRCARRARDAGLNPVVVVLEPGAGSPMAELEGLGVTAVTSPDPSLGMNASLRAGVAALGESPACLVVLPDMPWVDEAMLRAFGELWERERPPLALSRYGAVTAPPTLFARALYAELASGGAGDRRGRELVRRHRARALVLDWAPALLADLDTPDDWGALFQRKR